MVGESHDYPHFEGTKHVKELEVTVIEILNKVNKIVLRYHF